ncbi:hypothetical protein C922_02891 [Plasmodium inui San Antonio 1]|uniref:U3 small nucleolar RNA-associated protein 14 n=1 Tax=Plasmodium inui San Antonio 1 TaxID=1237626 RepID=W7A4F5_9APIC|nr:hypothetical protein C922_02891 [Plasmodium inui San Antonio 1]EUD66570.1 hypothetical protein C922_02891 [Plasmodium inui San Antonio 1]
MAYPSAEDGSERGTSMEHLGDASTTLSGGSAERRSKGKKAKKGGELKKLRRKEGLAKKATSIKMERLIERGKIPSLKRTMKRKMSQVKGASANGGGDGDDCGGDDCRGDSRRALQKRRRKEKRKGKKLSKGKKPPKVKQSKSKREKTEEEDEEAEEEEEDEEDGLHFLQREDVILEEEKQMTTRGMIKKRDPSENLIQFLRMYNDQGEGVPKRRKCLRKDDREEEGEVTEEDAEAESYQYLSQKDDVYKIEKPAEPVNLSDFLYTEDVVAREQIGDDINMLTRGQLEKGKTSRHISILEEQKMNEHLAYVNNVDLINKMNRSFYVISNAQGVHFGQGGKNGEGEVTSEEFLNKSLLRRGARVGEGQGGKHTEQRSGGTGALGGLSHSTANPDDSLTTLQFEAEMQKNLRMSKMLIVSDDVLKTEREKKRDELKKIAQLKALLLQEEKKNKYKKRIKSKSYRRHLRMKEKKEEEKILAKIYSEHPDLAENLANYEKEYAQKRNLINNVKKRKTVRLLNRYKNEELKKQMLRSFQAEKEEKNALRRIIERAVVEEEDGGGSGTDEGGRGSGTDERGSGNPKKWSSIRGADDTSDDEVDTSSLTKKDKVRRELQKRNLERFSFVRNAEERKRDDELYQQRKRLLDKVERKRDEKDEKDPMASCSSDEGSDAERTHLDLGLSNEVRRSSSKEASKARAQLARDADLVNALRKGGILGSEEGHLGGNSAEENPLGVALLENPSGVVPMEEKPEEEKPAEEKPEEEKPAEEKSEEEKPEEEKPAEEKPEAEKPAEEKSEEEKPEEENPEEVDPSTVRDLCDINAIDSIDAIDAIDQIGGESLMQNFGENLTVYNFENEVYEEYVNINPETADGKIPREDDELLQLSDDERVTTERVSQREWCNYETLLELEKKKVLKEKEMIEKKKRIPIHTISVFNRKDRKFEKYFVDKVPYPYERKDYQKTLNINLNKEVNDISAHAKLIAPRLSNRVGNIVSPLVRNPFEIARILTLKRGKNRSKL